MPNRQINNQVSNNVKTQIYGSNNEIPIQVDEKGILMVSDPKMASGMTALSVPEMTIGSMPEVDITSMPSVTINSMPEMVIAAMPDITIEGLPSGNGALEITGFVDLAPDAWVAISGMPTVLIEQPLSVTGVASIAGLTLQYGALPIALSGTPTVVINQPIEVTGNVNLASGAVVSVTGNFHLGSFTSIMVTTFTESPFFISATTLLSGVTDVSAFKKISYMLYIQTNGTLSVQTITPKLQRAPINDQNYFVTTDIGTDLNLSAGDSSSSQMLTDDNNSNFSQVAITFISAGTPGGSVTFTVYLQGYLY